MMKNFPKKVSKERIERISKGKKEFPIDGIVNGILRLLVVGS